MIEDGDKQVNEKHVTKEAIKCNRIDPLLT